MGLWSRRNWLTLAALNGFLAVAFGAFAAHGMDDARGQELLRTGSLYAFVHTLATFACLVVMQAGGRVARFAPAFFLGGALLFSGSLYALAFGAPRMLGMVTPIGGTLFMIGWGVLVCASRGIDRQA